MTKETVSNFLHARIFFIYQKTSLIVLVIIFTCFLDWFSSSEQQRCACMCRTSDNKTATTAVNRLSLRAYLNEISLSMRSNKWPKRRGQTLELGRNWRETFTKSVQFRGTRGHLSFFFPKNITKLHKHGKAYEQTWDNLFFAKDFVINTGMELLFSNSFFIWANNAVHAHKWGHETFFLGKWNKFKCNRFPE